MMRLRKTDLIGIVGLGLLLAWTPAYLGESAAERPFVGGETLTVAPPRDGMSVTLEAIVQEGDGPARAFGPIATMRFAATGGPEDPPGSVHSFVLEIPALSFETTYVNYTSRALTLTTHFGADGLAVWQERIETIPVGGGDMHQRSGVAAVGCGRVTWLNHHAVDRLHYTQDTLPILVERPAGACGPETAKAPLDRVARHGEGLLVGGQHVRGDRLFQSAWDSTTRQAIDTCGFGLDWTPLVPADGTSSNTVYTTSGPFAMELAERLRPRQTFRTPCDARDHFERWGWLSPAFPVPVGHHFFFKSVDDQPLLRLDIVPQVIEPGQGPALPLVHANTIRTTPGATLLVEPQDRLRVADLRDDATPLLHGLSLRDVLAETAPTTAQFFTRPPHLVEFWMAAEGPAAPVTPNAEGDPLALVREAATEHAPRLRSSWWLYLSDGAQARVLKTDITIDTLTMARSTAVTDLCTSPGDWGPCGPTSSFALQTEAITPGAALAEAQRLTAHEVGDLRWPDTGNRTMMRFAPLRVGERHQQPDLDEGQGTISWEAGHDPNLGSGTPPRFIDGTLAADTGLPMRYFDRRMMADEDQGPPPAAATSAVLVQPLRPLSTKTAAAGLLLVALSLLGRAWVGLKAGGHLGFFSALYAKIHKERVLEHGRREAIVELLRAEPGLTLKEIQVRLGLGWGAAVHHLETLRRNGHIVRLVHGRGRHHFLAGATTAHERLRVVVARDPTYAAFLAAVRAHPGADLQALAALLPQGVHGTSRTGKRLAGLGLVEKRRDGRHVRFYPLRST